MENHKIDVTNKYWYEYSKPENRERTESRLKQLNEMGMELVGEAQFGIKGVMSGLYIEMVWSYSNELWDGYIKWAKDLAEEKNYVFVRPKTRGELMTALRENKKCEVVASNEEITSLVLQGWAPDIKFKTKPSRNDGWVIYELV